MVDTQITTPAILSPQDHLPLLDQDQHDQAQGQALQQQQQEQQNTLAMYQSQHFHDHHHKQQQKQLEEMTREFLVQNMTTDPTGISQGSAGLLQLQHAANVSTAASTTLVLEEELNIYDYIHAKQEDEDEHEGEDQAHVHVHEHDAVSDSLSSSSVLDTDPFSSHHHHHHHHHQHTMQQSPVLSSSSLSSPVLSAHSPSSSTFSALSPPSPSSSLSSGAQHDDYVVDGDHSEQDSSGLATIHIKQESLDSTSLLGNHADYMDASMDLYGPAESSLITSQNDLMPPPPQDLFRMLMEELQTQAAIQREKFFTDTTGSGTGMDSVEFLFHGPQTQEEQAQTPTTPSMTSISQAQMKAVSQSAEEMDGAHSEVSMSFNVNHCASATAGTVAAAAAVEQEFNGQCSMASSMHVDDLSAPPSDATRAPPPAGGQVASLTSSQLQDVVMETVEPEGDQDLPASPTYSSSSSSCPSSGSVTPELTSPVDRKAPSSSSKTSVVRVAFTRIANHRSKTAGVHNNNLMSTTDSRNNGSSGSNRNTKGGQSALVSPITELSFQSAFEQHNTRRRSAATALKEESPGPSVITMQPAPKKRRKLSRDVENKSLERSSRLSALPSPPASVRTTPPLQPNTMDVSSAIESLELPSARMDQDEPVTPTSPMSIKAEPGMDMTIDSLSTARSSTLSSSSESTLTTAVGAGEGGEDKKAAASPNANNKRPWTPEEEKLLLKLVDNRTPIKDIAETLNRSVHSVRSRRQVLTDPGFVKGNGHAQPRRSKPDPASKLPTYSQMAFLSLARLPELQGTLNDVASMVEKLFSRHLNRIPRTGHKNLQIWRAQISDALAHEKGHPRPRFESFGVKRGRQWVYRLTDFGKGVMEAMGGVDQICEDLLKNNEMAGGGLACGPDGEAIGAGGAGAGLGQGNGYGYSYCPETAFNNNNNNNNSSNSSNIKSSSSSSSSSSDNATGSSKSSSSTSNKEPTEEMSAENLAASNAIANAMAAMAAGLAAMTAVEDEKSATAAAAAAVADANAASGSRASNTHQVAASTTSVSPFLEVPLTCATEVAKEKSSHNAAITIAAITTAMSAPTATTRSGRKVRA
ncbi:hypothetical protein EDD11_006399 [Mortierella claussenii]|nr:hypothetical protein EDD11_006399 [Mortierella claussenii]